MWNHSTLTQHQKYQVFASHRACLICCIRRGCAYPNGAELVSRRYVAFEKSLGIANPYISHVTNESVMQHAACPMMSFIRFHRQLMLLWRLAHLPFGDAMRTCAFQDGSLALREVQALKRKGKLKQLWQSELFRLVIHVCGDRNQPSKAGQLST